MPTYSGPGFLYPLVSNASPCDDGSGGSLMQKEYVRAVEGVYRIGETRVSLDSLVYLFREGLSAEAMVESYPALTLEQVHGALAFYLGIRGKLTPI